MPMEFIELAGEVHQRMPFHCAQKVAKALNDQSKPVRGSRIAVIGVSYKAGVGDMREAPALKIMELLAQDGARLVYHDDHVPAIGELRSQPLEQALEGSDVAVIVTAHPDLDLELIADKAPVVVDFRGVTRGLGARRVVRL
jgi:UDP-N-acetyl-D-glucosamine dehydrogenase